MGKIILGTEDNFRRVKEGKSIEQKEVKTVSKSMLSSYGSINLFNLPKRRVRKTASSTVKTQDPEWYVPEFQTTDWFIPKSIIEIYNWARYFYRVDPIVAISIDIHSSFPISRFEIDCTDPTIKKFFEDLSEKLSLYQTLLDIGLEYFKLGDVFPYGLWDDDKGQWKKIIMFPPENIKIEASPLTGNVKYALETTSEIKKLFTGKNKDEESRKVWNSLSKEVQEAISKGKEVPLDERCISHLAHKMSPYHLRGTPLIARLFKVLMYEDKLVEAQYAIADRHVTPITLVQAGTPDNPPPPEELENIQAQIDLASKDPDYTMISSWDIKIQKIGASGSILDLSRERDYIEKQKLAGLGISKAMLHGEGPTYQTSTVAYEALVQRYVSYRTMLSTWIEQKIFKPVSVVRKFIKNGELIVPKVTWQKLRLRDETQRLSYVLQAVNAGKVSVRSFLNMLDLDYESEKQYLKEEQDSIFQEQGGGRRYERKDKQILAKINSDPYLKALFRSDWTKAAKYIALSIEESLEEVHTHFLDRVVTGIAHSTAELLCAVEIDNVLFNYFGLVVKEGSQFASFELKKEVIDVTKIITNLHLQLKDKLSDLRSDINLIRLFNIKGDKTVDSFLRTEGEEHLPEAKKRLLEEIRFVTRNYIREAFTKGMLEVYQQAKLKEVHLDDKVYSIEEASKAGKEGIYVFYPKK